MNHAHLPALNRYTSPHQYAALKEIGKTKTLIPLLQKGSMSKTVGSLIRSAWVSPITFTDETGVLREGWEVNDAGLHAMKLYEAKLEEQRKIEEAIARRKAEKNAKEAELFHKSLLFYRALFIAKKLEIEANTLSAELWTNDAQRVFKMAQAQAQRDMESGSLTPELLLNPTAQPQNS